MSDERRFMMAQDDDNVVIKYELEVPNQGTSLCTVTYDGRIFKKYGNGFAICAIANVGGYYGPIIVSKDTAQGWSVQVWGTTIHRATTALNNTYYFTDTNEYFWRNKSDIQFDTFDLNEYTGVSVYDSAREAAQDLLDYYLGVI